MRVRRMHRSLSFLEVEASLDEKETNLRPSNRYEIEGEK